MSPPDSADPPPPDEDPPSSRSLEQAYGRTWELELLISGGVTFALLQLPSAIDRRFWRLDALATGPVAESLQLGYSYSKVMVYALIAGFLLHLSVRAFWVGLIGLDSVFPRGVRWERLDYGPVTQEYYREHHRPLRVLANAVDRFCSVIFSFAFLLVLISIVSVILAALSGAVAVAVSGLLFDGERLDTVYRVVFYTFLAQALAFPLLDRLLRRRAYGRRVRGALRAGTRVTYFGLAGPAYVPIMNVLLSNLNRKAMNGLFVAALVGLFGFHILHDLAIPRGRIAVDGYAFLPANPGSRGIDPRYYESLSGDESIRDLLPSIASDVVRDPYLRLFLPYHPERHAAAIRSRCPEMEPLQDTGLRWRTRDAAPPPPGEMEGVLACLASLQPITLNGAARDDLRFHFATHPRTGLRGIVSYIPVQALPEGENLLVVAPLPEVERDLAEEDSDPPPHYIPFWVSRAVSGPAAPFLGW